MRLLLKLSGEQLAGDDPRGFSVERARWIAREILRAKREFRHSELDSGSRKEPVDSATPDKSGAQNDEDELEIIVVVGAGNFVRGANFADDKAAIQPVSADNMGMLGTMINAVALADVFNAAGLPTRALSNVSAPQILDDYTYRRAMSHLAKDRVVIVAGGTGRPYFTTDTSALNLAIELNCDLIAKATKVDGVYDKDPAQFADAQKLDQISHDEALRDGAIRVMDKAALALAAEHAKPVIIFELLHEGNIAKVARGDKVGTRVG